MSATGRSSRSTQSPTLKREASCPSASIQSSRLGQVAPISSEAPNPPEPRTVSDDLSNRQLVAWMFSFLRPVKARVALACLFLTAWIVLEVLTVRQTAEAVNGIARVATSRTEPGTTFPAFVLGDDPVAAGLRWTVAILGGLTLLLAITAYLREVANGKLSMHMVYFIREAIYDKLQRVGLAYHDRVSTGELINRALSDLQNVRTFIQSAVLVTLEIALIVGGYVLLLLTRSPGVAALSLAPLPLWVWYVMRFSRRAQPAQKAVMEVGDRNISIITENIAGVHVVKAFATERQEIEKYGRNTDEFFARVMHRIRMYANFTPTMRGIAMGCHLVLFLAAGLLILKGRMAVGDILLLGAAMGAILGRLQQVSVINEQYQNAIVSARRLREVLNQAPTVFEQADARALPAGPGAVRFESVTFGYDPAKPVLRDVSFEAPGGSIVAIVGPTGAGKTTLVNLVARFYDPQQGRILIDGVDARSVTLDSLRTQVAFVFQETYLFSDTVEGNVAYGRPFSRTEMMLDLRYRPDRGNVGTWESGNVEAGRADPRGSQIHIFPLSHAGWARGQVEAASRLAQAHDFVEDLPRGYETMLGERGANLSGGQRQRLAIARAIMANPRILVLDDATASVDPETEELIDQGMRFAMHGRTTFIIAHRISTAKRADMVIVLDGGRIANLGTHDELMKRDRHYREIAAVQLFGDMLDLHPPESPSHMDRVLDADRVADEAALARAAAPPSRETDEEKMSVSESGP